ncbi:hypothetical protein cypCar_00042923 [Cyprinus carpio]|nr:hypothetical protein cypCar_00042923 [Cyprinus carpio]
MSEVHVTENSPVEEVGPSLFPNKPLKSKSKLNLLQFVKGGSSSYQSTSHAQTVQSSSGSASLPQALNQQPSSSLASFGSAVAGGFSLGTQYAASGSGQVVSTLGEGSSYPAKLGVSGQSSSDALHVSSSQEPSVQLAGASLPIFSKKVPYSSSSAPGAISTSRSSPALSVSLGQPVSSQSEVGYSGLSRGASNLYTPYSNTMLSSSISSQSTNVQSSPSVSTSTQSRSGTQLATSSYFIPVQGGSSSVSVSLKPQGTLGQYAPMSPTKYVSAPQATTNSGSSHSAGSPVSPLSQMGASGQFTSRGGYYYRGLLPQSQASSSQYALGYSKPISSPQSDSSQSTSVLSSSKQYSSASKGSSGAQFGASTGFASQGTSSSSSGSVQSQGTTSQFAPGSPSSYLGLSLSSPQAGPSTNVQGSLKRLASTFVGSSGTQAGSSTAILQGSPAYGGSSQPQDTTIWSVPGPHSSYASASLSSPQAGPSTVQGSRKRLTSTYMGSSGTQAGSSSFTLQGIGTYGGSPRPQDAASQFSPGSPSSYPGLSQSSPKGVASQSSSQKRFTSAYQGSSGAQFGVSTGFASQGMSSSSSGSVQSQGTTSQFAPGSPSSYLGLSLSSPQAGPSTNVQGSLKRLASTFVGSSGTQAGSSTAILQGSTAYGGSSQPRDTTSWSAPGPHSSHASASPFSPQAGPSTVQASQKQFTSAYQGSSGAQFGASTGFASQGTSSSSSGSVQSQGTTSQFAPGSYSYAGVSLSSPQAGPSTVQGPWKPLTSTFTGSSGTQVGSSTPFTLHGSPAYGGSHQPQDMASPLAPSFPYEGLYCNCVLSPQGVDRSSTVLSSQKPFISSYGTQSGSSTPFTLQGSITYDGSPQPQGTASQFALISSSYPSVLSPSQGVASQSIRGSLKKLSSTFAGSSGTQAGSSTAILQGSTAYGGSVQPQDVTSQSAPGPHSSYTSASLSSPQAVASPGSWKQFISTSTGSTGKRRW